MLTETIVEAPGWDALDLPALAEAAASAALRDAGLDPGAFEVALLGCDDARIAALNAAFRGRDAPTNVLAWPSAARDPAGSPAEGMLGDVALSWDTCAEEARAQGKPLAEHAFHLMVHAVLHLLGHDHDTEAAARLMEGRERTILASMGMPDPYAALRATNGATRGKAGPIDPDARPKAPRRPSRTRGRP